MLKKRSDSKKKKGSTNNSKSKKSLISSETDKFLFNLTGGFLGSKPNLQTTTHLIKSPKSSTATPSSKIRKQSKQNFYQSVFHSKKTSETMTPFEYEQ